MAEQKKKRPYLYEVDILRLIFISGVLLNHTTSLVGSYISNSSWEQGFLDATHLSLHFTRMGFMFITGLVLFIQHYHKEMHVWSFWKKRYLSVGATYISWAFLLLLGDSWLSGKLNWATFWPDLGSLIIHGNDYYMYYIIVTFQLYLVFPLLVWVFKRFNQHHLHILLLSFLVQILMLVFIKYGMPHIDKSGWPYLFKNYGFNLLVYQFYFILGAYASIHYAEFKDFIIKNHRFIGWTTVVLAIGTIGLFFYNQDVLKLTMSKTLEIHQPYVFIYDVFIIAFIIWVGLQYAKFRSNGMPKWFIKLVDNGAKIGFGMYLGQTIALGIVEMGLRALHMSNFWNWLLIPVIYAVVWGIDFGMSYLFFKIPPFGILVGRPQWHISKLWRRKEHV